YAGAVDKLHENRETFRENDANYSLGPGFKTTLISTLKNVRQKN
ncbi:unnamed protein product, partial [Allacma fusca]